MRRGHFQERSAPNSGATSPDRSWEESSPRPPPPPPPKSNPSPTVSRGVVGPPSSGSSGWRRSEGPATVPVGVLRERLQRGGTSPSPVPTASSPPPPPRSLSSKSGSGTGGTSRGDIREIARAASLRVSQEQRAQTTAESAEEHHPETSRLRSRSPSGRFVFSQPADNAATTITSVRRRGSAVSLGSRLSSVSSTPSSPKSPLSAASSRVSRGSLSQDQAARRASASTTPTRRRGQPAPPKQDTGHARIRVSVRLRPPSMGELQEGCGMLEVHPSDRTVVVHHEKDDKLMAFDHVFGPTATQLQVYKEMAAPLVEDVLRGFNGCIVAYGMTGAGKTYTLSQLDDRYSLLQDAPPGADCIEGVIPRSMRHLFQLIKEQESKYVFEVKMSYLQIYMESVQDLLFDHQRSLNVREGPDGVFVESLSLHHIRNPNDVMALLECGENAKTIAQTKMNRFSSRSHTIFTVYVVRKDRERSANGTLRTLRSKFTCVDLAGSERASRTHPEGMQLEEAKSINLSLTCLGNVIATLSDPKFDKQGGGSSSFVNWRDSKLTRLLQDTLGGNSRCSLMVNVGPADSYISETYSSLLFGQRAMRVVVHPVLNEDVDYRKAAAELQNQYLEAVGLGGGGGGGSSPSRKSERDRQLEKENEQLRRELAEERRHSEVVEAAHRDLQHQYRLVDLELNKTLKRCGLLEEQLRAKSPESLSASGIGKPVKAKAGTVPPFALAGRMTQLNRGPDEPFMFDNSPRTSSRSNSPIPGSDERNTSQNPLRLYPATSSVSIADDTVLARERKRLKEGSSFRETSTSESMSENGENSLLRSRSPYGEFLQEMPNSVFVLQETVLEKESQIEELCKEIGVLQNHNDSLTLQVRQMEKNVGTLEQTVSVLNEAKETRNLSSHELRSRLQRSREAYLKILLLFEKLRKVVVTFRDHAPVLQLPQLRFESSNTPIISSGDHSPSGGGDFVEFSAEHSRLASSVVLDVSLVVCALMHQARDALRWRECVCEELDGLAEVTQAEYLHLALPSDEHVARCIRQTIPGSLHKGAFFNKIALNMPDDAAPLPDSEHKGLQSPPSLSGASGVWSSTSRASAQDRSPSGAMGRKALEQAWDGLLGELHNPMEDITLFSELFPRSLLGSPPVDNSSIATSIPLSQSGPMSCRFLREKYRGLSALVKELKEWVHAYHIALSGALSDLEMTTDKYQRIQGDVERTRSERFIASNSLEKTQHELLQLRADVKLLREQLDAVQMDRDRLLILRQDLERDNDDLEKQIVSLQAYYGLDELNAVGDSILSLSRMHHHASDEGADSSAPAPDGVNESKSRTPREQRQQLQSRMAVIEAALQSLQGANGSPASHTNKRSSSAGGSDAPIISGTGNQHLGSPLSSRVHSPREPILSLYELQEDQVPARTSALLDEQHWRLRASPRGEQEQRSDRKGTDPMDPMHSLRQFLADRMQKRSQRETAEGGGKVEGTADVVPPPLSARPPGSGGTTMDSAGPSSAASSVAHSPRLDPDTSGYQPGDLDHWEAAETGEEGKPPSRAPVQETVVGHRPVMVVTSPTPPPALSMRSGPAAGSGVSVPTSFSSSSGSKKNSGSNNISSIPSGNSEYRIRAHSLRSAKMGSGSGGERVSPPPASSPPLEENTAAAQPPQEGGTAAALSTPTAPPATTGPSPASATAVPCGSASDPPPDILYSREGTLPPRKSSLRSGHLTLQERMDKLHQLEEEERMARRAYEQHAELSSRSFRTRWTTTTTTPGAARAPPSDGAGSEDAYSIASSIQSLGSLNPPPLQGSRP